MCSPDHRAIVVAQQHGQTVRRHHYADTAWHARNDGIGHRHRSRLVGGDRLKLISIGDPDAMHLRQPEGLGGQVPAQHRAIARHHSGHIPNMGAEIEAVIGRQTATAHTRREQRAHIGGGGPIGCDHAHAVAIRSTTIQCLAHIATLTRCSRASKSSAMGASHCMNSALTGCTRPKQKACKAWRLKPSHPGGGTRRPP